ncbi:protein translocase subunit SecD [Rhodospirillum centenum]|uniref:Multifunctional fusion protein n=1 Tax=Rhodospirillum centenum (strain ATCC 51521 / SW) TaxID=414684 RepID=B6ISK0_RHOCS|nr:protein translocase subunit SecD [Rhodospirillum centenum]ACI98436.1 protein-export membrane protein SecD [Rhodospirillum centenum SW]
MLNFSPLRTAVVTAICLLGVIFSLPSLLPAGTLPAWLPYRHINLGLDLQGGSYLLLQVDADTVRKETLSSAGDQARALLRDAGIRPTGVTADADTVTVSFADDAQVSPAVAALRPLWGPIGPGQPGEFDAAEAPRAVRLTLTEGGFQAKMDRVVQQSLEIVRRRIDETGVNEPIVARQGSGRILVQLPGVSDPGRIKRLLGQTAKMTFHLVVDDATLNPGSPPPPGTEWLPNADRGAGGGRVLVRKRVEVDGATLVDAQPSADSRTGQWVVNFRFDSIGARRFGDITKDNVGRLFAIVLDGRVISAPRINEPILGGRGQISGSFTAQSATELAVLLRAGALPAPLTVVEERSIGPELGAESIRAGLIACLVGFVLVVSYMAMAYGRLGFYANVALIFNLFLTIAALSLLEATLTLPGIAGLLLTLGMSVDANILINERVREEARRGRTPLAALEAGFSKAYATITDSNLTTLIKMIILYAVGTGTVKGFAVTISLGIITSMFTATVVARMITARWFRRVKPKILKVGTWLRPAPDNLNISFMRGRHIGIAMSVLLSAASIALFVKPGLNYGIDFAGGIVIEVRTPEATDIDRLRDAVSGIATGSVAIQEFGSPRDTLIRLERQEGAEEAQQQVVKTLQAKLVEIYPGLEIRRVEAVGASVSAELFQNGMIALGLAAIAMLAYITFRFEWQFGVGAVVTMMLDVTKTIGFFALTGIQFNLTAIAAILTIMGYSINDKVVVYDRVRENLRLYRKMPLRELIDRSINETMGRTISTSIAIFLATLPLALFAGEGLREFAWVLLFGVVLATSSSIFIAAPILLYLGEKRLRRGPAEDAGGTQVADGAKSAG